MKNILKINTRLFFLLALLWSGFTVQAQFGENGEVPFDFNGQNDLASVDIPGRPGSGDSWDRPSLYWDLDWKNYPSANNIYDFWANNKGSDDGSGGAATSNTDKPKNSIIVLTKTVKPGQKHIQAIKGIRSETNRLASFVSQLIVNGQIIGTITFSDVTKINGVDMYTKLTVEVYPDSPTDVSFIVPFKNDDNDDNNRDQKNILPGKEEYDINQVIKSDFSFSDNKMYIEFYVPINESEDMYIRGDAIDVDTPQSYEDALNAVSNNEYRITNGVVKIRNDKGIFTLISEVDVNSPTILQRVKNLAAIITKSIGGNGKEIFIDIIKGVDLSSKNPASTLKKSSTSSTIYLNSNGGFSPSLNNINNFKNIIKHEIFHADDNRIPGFTSNISTHADVYVKTANHYTFNDTTDDFKTSTAGSFAKYLLNMAINPNIALSDILTKIDSFNKNNAGVQIIKPAGAISKGTLTLRVQYKNITSEPIEYEKLTI